MGYGACGHWLVRIEWHPAGWSVCLLLLIFRCTIKSRSSLLAPAHPGGPVKRAVKRLWCGGGTCPVCPHCGFTSRHLNNYFWEAQDGHQNASITLATQSRFLCRCKNQIQWLSRTLSLFKGSRTFKALKICRKKIQGLSRIFKVWQEPCKEIAEMQKSIYMTVLWFLIPLDHLCSNRGIAKGLAWRQWEHVRHIRYHTVIWRKQYLTEHCVES